MTHAPRASSATRAVLLAVLGLLWLAGSGPAQAARSVAVLPLDEAAGSEAYEGLGRAIAGMLLSDLSRAEGLQLVERQRLDALLSEIELGEGGFVDPATAASLGHGVGAEWVVMGSWSVVGQTFLLDARVVDVGSSEVVAGVDAQGQVSDFVSVEKELVEELLAAVKVELSGSARRQVLGSAPTEDFEAFRVYGAGLDLEYQGRIDEARDAYERALQRDPAFQEAREAMAGLASRLETERARMQSEAADATTRKWLGALEAVPDERSRASGFRHNTRSRARFAVRSVALEALGRHCQRAEEMWAFLDRHDWDLPSVEGQYAAVLQEAHSLGLIEKPPSWTTIPFDGPGFSSMGSNLWSTSRFVTGLSLDMVPGRGFELVAAELSCQDEAGRPLRMAAIRQALVDHDQLALVPDPQTYPLVTLGDHLTIQEARYQALAHGLDPTTRRRAEALVDRMRGQGVHEFWATNAAQRVLMAAEAYERRKAARLGLSEEQLVAVASAVLAGSGPALDLERSICQKAAELARPAVVGRMAAYEEAAAKGPSPRLDMVVDGLGYGSATLVDLGCVAGVEGRAADALGALAWVATASERVRPDKVDDTGCRAGLEALPTRTNPAQLESSASAELALQSAVLTLSWYHAALVLPGCVNPGR